MEWKYIKEISESDVINVEEKFNIKLSNQLKEIILKYNNGRPSKRCFDTINEKEKVLQKIISYNKEHKGNIYIYSGLIEKGVIPFAVTEFGDVICEYKDGTVHLYKHETDEFEYVAENVSEFINEKLYE